MAKYTGYQKTSGSSYVDAFNDFELYFDELGAPLDANFHFEPIGEDDNLYMAPGD